MLTRLSVIIVLTTFGFCYPSSGQVQVVAKTKSPTNTFDSHALQEAWLLFVNAVMTGNAKSIKALSTTCVYCPDCRSNTPKEDKSFKRKMRKSSYEYLIGELYYTDIDKFIRDDLPLIFDKRTKVRSMDSSKCILWNHGEQKDVKWKECVVSVSERMGAEHYEVLVDVLDSFSQREGYQKAFDFIRIGNSYRFCGYSTIP